MSKTRFDGTNWVDCTINRRYDGANWIDVGFERRYDGANWIDVWNTRPVFTLSQEVNVKPWTGEPMYTLLAENRLQIFIVGQYNASSDEHFVEFKCNDIVIPAGVSSVHTYTLNGAGSNREILIGIRATSGSGYYYTGCQCTLSDIPVSVSITNNNAYEHVPAFRFKTNNSVGNKIIVQLDSFVVNGKTYNPIFKL